MTIHCKSCGKRINAVNFICPYCSGENRMSSGDMIALRRKYNLHKLIIILSALAAFVLLIVILNANLLLPWQRGARKNKQVILEYAEEHYPEASFVEGHYNTAKFFIWNDWGDAGVFNLDGIEFKITAEAGKILIDGYPRARAYAQFDQIIQDGFLKPRGITAQTDYFFADNYYEIYPYTGSLGVKIKLFDQGSTPQEFGWFYDFYKWWKKEGAFLTSYSVYFYIITDNKPMYHLSYDDDSEYPDEAAFYSAFLAG